MRLLRRRAGLPAGHRPALAAGERVLAFAYPDDAGTPLVATNLGLWLPGDTPPVRLGWHEIHKVTWSGRELTVVPAARVTRRDGYEVVADLPPRGYPLAEPGDLAHEVRVRVTRSVGYSVHHPLPGTGGVRVAARRVPGVDGLCWTVRYDLGVDPDDEAVRAATADLVAADQARSGTGPSGPAALRGG